jgi:regulatory protein
MAENDLYKASLTKAMSLCAGREHCIEDIRNKLSAWGVDNAGTDKIINTLLKENFINEERYTLAFVKDKFIYNKWGKVKIRAHLRAKKIPALIVSKGLDSLDHEQYITTLRSMLANHRTKIKSKDQYDLKAKLMRFGLSKGFESELLYDLLNEPEY